MGKTDVDGLGLAALGSQAEIGDVAVCTCGRLIFVEIDGIGAYVFRRNRNDNGLNNAGAVDGSCGDGGGTLSKGRHQAAVDCGYLRV